MNQLIPGHYVAIFGGAVAGSEAADKLTQRGIRCAVFEQNDLPYGKIETGLPKWHIKLRDSQERKIDQKLRHPLVDFIPNIKLGEDIQFEDLARNWGFSAVLLATGAWRDRPIPVKGIDEFIDNGLYYQNPFVAWFNQKHDPDYKGPQFEIPDDTIIIGGGLASFDVVKILVIEQVQLALERKNIKCDILTIEKLGVPNVLENAGLTFKELGIRGCSLFYRRTVTDMPLTSLPDNPTQHDIETAHRVRQRIFDNMQSKYLFQFKECHVPVDIITQKGKLQGLVFRKTEIINGRVTEIEGSDFQATAPLVISAIGSLPESIDGVPMNGNVYDVTDPDSGKLNGYEAVFALGNAVTGRGNIKESQVHGRKVSERVMDEFLAWREEDYEEIFKRAEENAGLKIETIGKMLKEKDVLDINQMKRLHNKIRDFQKRVGYQGDYDNWINEHIPVRLEHLIGYQD